MNFIKIIILLNLIFSTFPIFGQTFFGTVTDQATHKPIPNANVYFVELATGTTTDETGSFTIEHYPKKGIHIQISHIGYTTINEVINLAKISERKFFLEPSHLKFEEVVVSVPTGKLRRENVVNVEQLQLSPIKRKASMSMAETITNIPGVELITTGTGIGKPVIRGLTGNRIVTYAQGIRIENQQWGDEHGLGIGELGIEHVEVIKGPASLLYGSDALGGVLYLVDQRYANHNSVEGFAQTRLLSNTLGTINNAGVKLHKENFKLNLLGSYSTIADYQIQDGKRILNTRFNEKNFKTSFGYNYKHWITNLRYSYLQNNFGLTEEPWFSNSTDKIPELPNQEINNHNLSLDNTLFTGDSRLNLILGFTNNFREEFEDSQLEPALAMRLNTFTYHLKWYSSAVTEKLNLITGIQGMVQSNRNSGEEELIPDANTQDLGAFAIVNYQLQNLQLQGGIRGDLRSIDSRSGDDFPALSRAYPSLNFSAGGTYQLEETALRANLATGFRAPNTSELLSDGVHEGTNRYEKGDSTLKSENAIQFDFSLTYETGHLSFSINPFYNRIQNYIHIAPLGYEIDNTPGFEYRQSEATLRGGEVGFHYHPHSMHWLHLESNLSYVHGEDDNKKPLPLIPAARLNSTIKIEFSKKGPFTLKDIFLEHHFKFKQDRNSEFETPTDGYHIFNIGFICEIKTKKYPIELSAGVKNLFNGEYIDHLSRFKSDGLPNPGINYYAGLKINFESNIEEP